MLPPVGSQSKTKRSRGDRSGSRGGGLRKNARVRAAVSSIHWFEQGVPPTSMCGNPARSASIPRLRRESRTGLSVSAMAMDPDDGPVPVPNCQGRTIYTGFTDNMPPPWQNGAMKTIACLLCLAAPVAAVAAESAVSAKIESVGLFKNGLASVQAVVAVPGTGDFRWDEVPHPLHGSFWIESDCEVEAESTVRRVEADAARTPPTGNLQLDLAGQEVTVTTKSTAGPPSQPLTGTVWSLPAPDPQGKWGTDYDWMTGGANRYWWSYRRAEPGQPAAPTTGSFLVLVQPDGSRSFIDQASIATVTTTKPAAKSMRDRPVVVFHVRKAPPKGGTINVHYLTRGMAWLPAYRVELGGNGKLALRMAAQVRNELMDLAETEVKLISGFPNVRFANVDSPLDPTVSLAEFFRQVAQGPAEPGLNIASNFIVSQSVGPMRRAESTPLLGPADEPGRASDDLHFRSIGRRSLHPGDTLSLDVAHAEAAFERIVDWTIPDRRNDQGRYDRNTQASADDAPWDAVRFQNPFDFPMTTAAVMVIDGGAFRGQSETHWTNPGQPASIRITRALSVRTAVSEVEEEGARETVWIGGNDYQRTRVKGTLDMENFRDREVTMVVRSQLSGELLEASDKPKASLRPEGAVQVNPQRELEWTVKLAPKATKSLTFRYHVLVDR